MSAASLRQPPDGPRRAIPLPMPPPSDNPSSYPRRVLLALCGLSPQVACEE
jgi:hypothetical protein